MIGLGNEEYVYYIPAPFWVMYIERLNGSSPGIGNSASGKSVSVLSSEHCSQSIRTCSPGIKFIRACDQAL